MAKKSVLSVLLLVLLLSACGESKQPPPVRNQTGSPTPSPLADGWTRFTSPEVGLSFEYPPLQGNHRYTYSPGTSECPHAFYSFQIERTDLPDPGHTYWFAGSTICDHYGREGWPTDVTKWGRDSKGYWVQTDGPERTHVLGLKELTTPDGSKALVFKPGGLSTNACGEADCPSQEDRAVAINFMKPHGGFTSLAFYFRDPTPLTDIERVIRSVSFSS